CIFTTRARGSPEKPGLGLGLIPGPGDCLGLAYRLSPATLVGDLEALFEREMGSGVYRPTWLEAHTREGPVPVLAFVVDKTHPQFAGDLKVDEMAALIAQGRGSYGACRDYLASTVDQLQRLGVPASEFESLLAQVDARAAGAPTRS
ncbi:MAG: gamma-glutamylcyclotransferase, partial [Gammaproteobacteria bacterium]|nr:gamma-glutamylcyclotransferase [Gammaproteobacteria bacterium]